MNGHWKGNDVHAQTKPDSRDARPDSLRRLAKLGLAQLPLLPASCRDDARLGGDPLRPPCFDRRAAPAGALFEMRRAGRGAHADELRQHGHRRPVVSGRFDVAGGRGRYTNYRTQRVGVRALSWP